MKQLMSLMEIELILAKRQVTYYIVYWDADGFLSIVFWNILYQVIFCEIICFQ